MLWLFDIFDLFLSPWIRIQSGSASETLKMIQDIGNKPEEDPGLHSDLIAAYKTR